MSKVMNKPQWLGNHVDLINFIAEKCENVKVPFKIIDLCREFQQKAGSKANYLAKVLSHLRPRIHELEDLRINLRAKMLFGLSAPIKPRFLKRLKQEASVELDIQKRIVYYEPNDRSFELEGSHRYPSSTSQYQTEPINISDDDRKLLNFLASKAKNVSFPLSNLALAREYKAMAGGTKHENTLYQRLRVLRAYLHRSKDYDKETRIRMMFVSGATMHDTILHDLRRDATVQIDHGRRMTGYRANDGSLVLKGTHPRTRIKTRLKETREEATVVLEDILRDKEDAEPSLIAAANTPRHRSQRSSKLGETSPPEVEYEENFDDLLAPPIPESTVTQEVRKRHRSPEMIPVYHKISRKLPYILLEEKVKKEEIEEEQEMSLCQPPIRPKIVRKSKIPQKSPKYEEGEDMELGRTIDHPPTKCLEPPPLTHRFSDYLQGYEEYVPQDFLDIEIKPEIVDFEDFGVKNSAVECDVPDDVQIKTEITDFSYIKQEIIE